MILFTGGGSIANACKTQFDCTIISARNLSDSELKSYIESATLVIHNAGLIQSNNLNELLASNLVFTKRVLDLVHITNPSIKVINVSSMSMLNTCDTYLPSNEMSNYALSKYFAELYCLNHSHENLTNVKFSTIFYNDNKKDGISKLAYDAIKNNRIRIYNDATSHRDIVPIEYIASILGELKDVTELPRCINIASGFSLPFSFFVTILKNKFNSLIIDNEKASFKPVLHEFSNFYKSDNIKIDIDMIKNTFTKYIDKLNEGINL